MKEDIYSIWSYISSSFDGKHIAYIYIWFSKKWEFAYVGQTNNQYGSLGRAWQHIQTGGTLRLRFEENLGVRLEEANDLTLVSFQLPSKKEFTGIESSYREAVEYLVQIKLIEKRATLQPIFRLLSRVRANNRVSNSSIEKIANTIVSDFVVNYAQEKKVC